MLEDIKESLNAGIKVLTMYTKAREKTSEKEMTGPRQ
jgi:hypothetical protein